MSGNSDKILHTDNLDGNQIKKTNSFYDLSIIQTDILPFFAESLLLNIQGLLKVAAENTRQNERQAVYEKSKYNILRDGTKHQRWSSRFPGAGARKSESVSCIVKLRSRKWRFKYKKVVLCLWKAL